MRIAYGPHKDQFGDLFLSSDNGRKRIVVVVHGGWWKDNQTLLTYPTIHLVDWLRARPNIAVWNLEYRRMESAGSNTAAPWPCTLQDVAAGFDLLNDLAAEHALDTSDILAIGHSAGAHLVAWAASRKNLSPDSALFSAAPVSPRTVCLLSGIYDLGRAEDLEQPGQIERLLSGAPEQFLDRLQQSCPTQLGLNEAVYGFCMHGERDDIVSAGQASAYCDAVGGKLENLPVSGGDHFCMLPTCDEAEPGWRQLVQRLTNVLDQ